MKLIPYIFSHGAVRKLMAPLALALALSTLPASAEISPQDVFSNDSLTALKPDVAESTLQDIKDPAIREAALAMKKGEYDLSDRQKSYEPYETVRTLAKRLKTSEYSKYENPTGIYFEGGEEAVLAVEGLKDDAAELKIHDFGPSGTEVSYPIKNGLNRIKVEKSGLAYISYYTDNFKNAPVIRVHFLNGKVNGVFDSSIHKERDWKKILDNTVCDVLDIKGKHVHLVYATKELKEFCPDKGLELINLYDQLINLQQEMMGLVKYDIRPKNRMFGRSIWQGFMHADGMGAAFHHDTLKELANPELLRKNSWGVAHEFGHVNQTRPGLKWVSTTEVTNNLFSIWSQYMLNPSYINLEDELHNDGDDNRVKGGRFNAYLNYAIVHGEQWLCQKGPDKMKDYENGGDHFVKLCPLWQLQLYFMKAKMGNPEFLPDIFEIVRNTDDEGKSNGFFQLEFMKNVCDVTEQDLTDFFRTTGMLKPIDKDMDDYSRAQLTITQEDCDKLTEYAKRYRKPDSPVIYYISRRSVDAFINKAAVTGTFGEGVEARDDNTLIVSHDVWKNVTVYEAYKGGKLERITLVGTDFMDNSATLVQYPEGCTRLEAVAWNGTKTLVYGKK